MTQSSRDWSSLICNGIETVEIQGYIAVKYHMNCEITILIIVFILLLKFMSKTYRWFCNYNKILNSQISVSMILHNRKYR